MLTDVEEEEYDHEDEDQEDDREDQEELHPGRGRSQNVGGKVGKAKSPPSKDRLVHLKVNTAKSTSR